ncbi:MAG: hypothetical protein OHK006_08100 [Thermodesulfovibrionales bacterium]
MPPKILIVDDERLILSAIERALAKVGYEIFAASNLKEVGTLLSKGPFDLLLTDVYLEDAVADDIIAAVRTCSPRLKVLHMSGSGSRVAPNFVEKPFKIDELRERVRSILDEPD